MIPQKVKEILEALRPADAKLRKRLKKIKKTKKKELNNKNG
jgi:hypothetical protein